MGLGLSLPTLVRAAHWSSDPKALCPGYRELQEAKTLAHAHTCTRTHVLTHTDTPHPHGHTRRGDLTAQRLRGTGSIEYPLILQEAATLCAGGGGGPSSPAARKSRHFQSPAPPRPLSSHCAWPGRGSEFPPGDRLRRRLAPGSGSTPDDERIEELGLDLARRPLLWTHALVGGGGRPNWGEQKRMRMTRELLCKTLILTFKKGRGQAQRTRSAGERSQSERWRRQLEQTERSGEEKSWGGAKPC